LIDLFNEDAWANHVLLGRWADLLLIAPLSCNTLSKMAHGFCDSLLMAVYLSATCPVMIAPAMDEDMWYHPATRNNLQLVANNGCHLLPVEHGELASGLTGEGRMAEPEDIIHFINSFFNKKLQLKGKKALVTAGPTYEALDPVRFIGNYSSGKMGYALAEELANRGAEVVLISGPVSLKSKSQNIHLIKVTAAEEMYDECMKQANDYDIAVMSAAVADYTPVQLAEEKIKKGEGVFEIKLKKTKDILQSFGKLKTDKQILVGFALETNDEERYALKKLEEKNADMVVLNSLRDEGAGFGKDTNKITLFKKSGEKRTYPTKPKELVAKDIVDSIIEMI
jgi:phosphopantothenoylcysteine decarboxylase/phosphopantothenate--cysteine ligase